MVGVYSRESTYVHFMASQVERREKEGRRDSFLQMEREREESFHSPQVSLTLPPSFSPDLFATASVRPVPANRSRPSKVAPSKAMNAHRIHLASQPVDVELHRHAAIFYIGPVRRIPARVIHS